MDISTKRELEKNGYAVIRGAFDPAHADEICIEIARVHSDFTRLKVQFPDMHKLGEWSIRSPHRASQVIHNFIYSAINHKLCRYFIGNEADLYWCTTAAKPAEIGKAFPWHQDAGYGEGPKGYIIFWAAFDDVDEENGCLWVIPGSHTEGIREHEYRKMDESSYAGVFLKDHPPLLNEMQPIRVQRGDIVCMDSKLIHATFQNQSIRPRRALIYAFLKPTPENSYMIRGSKEVIDPYLRDGEPAPT